MKKFILLAGFSMLCYLSGNAQAKFVKYSLDDILVLSNYIKELEQKDSLNSQLIKKYEVEIRELKVKNYQLKEEVKASKSQKNEELVDSNMLIYFIENHKLEAFSETGK